MYFISLFSCLLESEQNRILDHGDSRDFGKKFCIGVTKYYIRKDTNVTFVCTFLLFYRVINFFLYLFRRSPSPLRLIQSVANVAEQLLRDRVLILSGGENAVRGRTSIYSFLIFYFLSF